MAGVASMSNESEPMIANKVSRLRKKPSNSTAPSPATTALTEAVAEKDVKDLHRIMKLTRLFDERCMMLQRQGRIGFYVPSFGQEAIAVGSAFPLKTEDWLFPSYREPGLFLSRGVALEVLLANLLGSASDICKGRQMPVHYSYRKAHLFSISSPIATQVIQAVGAAVGMQIQKTKAVVATYFGDGATSANDFHTALTFAGVYKAPVIFVCTNNQLAISVPVSHQSGARCLADKAVGYGVAGESVDGNDLIAVIGAMTRAVERARSGQGATLLECVTYRLGPHSSSDDPTRYRSEEEYQRWKKRDPLLLSRVWLQDRNAWSEEEEAALELELKSHIQQAIELAEQVPPPNVESLFDDVYATLPSELREQRKALQEEAAQRGAFANTSEAFPL